MALLFLLAFLLLSCGPDTDTSNTDGEVNNTSQEKTKDIEEPTSDKDKDQNKENKYLKAVEQIATFLKVQYIRYKGEFNRLAILNNTKNFNQLDEKERDEIKLSFGSIRSLELLIHKRKKENFQADPDYQKAEIEFLEKVRDKAKQYAKENNIIYLLEEIDWFLESQKSMFIRGYLKWINEISQKTKLAKPLDPQEFDIFFCDSRNQSISSSR